MKNTVVLIDDDPDDLDLMKEAISMVDPRLECVSYVYPEEAMRALLTRQDVIPGYIFIDINMPRMSGDKCLEALRKQSHFDPVVISLYSTSMPPAVTEALKIAGASHTFEKPVRMSTYVDILKRIVMDT
jgi:DNA-binding NtrC family response regulator